jgi:ubiquinone/menaquinone biosynthesis C-methylase UbiE
MKDQVLQSKESHAEYNNKSYWKGAFDAAHPDTARHYAMLKHGLALVNNLNPEKILTIGDNLGRDAGFFKKAFPSCHCTASDLCTSGIAQAAVDGFVDKVEDVDVESIPYNSDSIDLVVAKEAFHHWPRPMLGLYEMLRVARQAVLLIEPNDIRRDNDLNSFPSKSSFADDYEEVGNYKYQISIREILKAAWSLYLPMCAVTGFNDPYRTPFDLANWQAEKELLDQMGRIGTRPYNLLAIAIYKKVYDYKSDSNGLDIRHYTRPLNTFMPNDTLE